MSLLPIGTKVMVKYYQGKCGVAKIIAHSNSLNSYFVQFFSTEGWTATRDYYCIPPIPLGTKNCWQVASSHVEEIENSLNRELYSYLNTEGASLGEHSLKRLLSGAPNCDPEAELVKSA